VRSVGHIARVKRIADNDPEYVTPKDMLRESWEDNKALILSMPGAHSLCNEAGDVATASLPVTEAGAIVFPRVPAFYAMPATFDDVVDHTVGRVLDLFNFDSQLVRRDQTGRGRPLRCPIP